MDNDAILKYDGESVDQNALMFTQECNFLEDLNPFLFPTQSLLENIDSLQYHPNKQLNSNNTSIYSTNCSSKNTPEHIPETLLEDS